MTLGLRIHAYNRPVPSPRFYAPAASSGRSRVPLGPGEARHLTQVLRLGPGADVRVFDGQGREWTARVATASPSEVQVDLVEDREPAREAPVRVTLAIGLLKGAQMDDVVRDATMLGVSRIAPMATAHVAVPAVRRRSSAALERWQRIAVGSAKQCGRAVVPEILPVSPFESVLAAAAGPAVMCVEPAVTSEGPPVPWTEEPPAALLALTGPEGGWAPEEVAAAVRGGAWLLHLGPRTLRADAVPTVLLSALWARWGWSSGAGAGRPTPPRRAVR